MEKVFYTIPSQDGFLADDYHDKVVKGHTKDCWCPTTKRLYLRTSENKKQKFIPCGMICSLCLTIQFDRKWIKSVQKLWSDKVEEIQQKRKSNSQNNKIRRENE